MVFGLFTRKPTAGDAFSSAPVVPEFNSPRPSDSGTRLPTPTPSTISLPASGRQSPVRFPTSLRAVFAGSTSDSVEHRDSELGGADGAESSPAAHPPTTPSPPPPPSIAAADAMRLYDLVLTIPAKTLHAYTLAHLRPSLAQSPSATSPPGGSGTRVDSITTSTTADPPSPETVGKLQKFFATLAPPPLLHCVRCHADFYAIENEEKDKACRVPHDDESALVSRLPGAGYETLWGCCGQTADGDGGEGPPDGWCYEGRHTVSIAPDPFSFSFSANSVADSRTHICIQTDIKRARFRADSTTYDDKLTSCLKLNCHGIRDRLPQPGGGSGSARQGLARRSNPSPARSYAVESVPRATRKRSRKSLKDRWSSASEDDQEDPSERQGSVRKGQSKQKQKEGDTSMVVDDPTPSRAKSHARTKASARSSSRARPPRSASSIASPGPGSTTNAVPPVPLLPLSSRPSSISVLMQGNAGTPRKPKSDAPAKPKTISRMLVSQSDVHAASDSDNTSSRARARPRTRSLGREHSDAQDVRSRVRALARNPSQVLRSRRVAKQASEDEVGMNSQGEDGGGGEARGRKKRRTGA